MECDEASTRPSNVKLLQRLDNEHQVSNRPYIAIYTELWQCLMQYAGTSMSKNKRRLACEFDVEMESVFAMLDLTSVTVDTVTHEVVVRNVHGMPLVFGFHGRHQPSDIQAMYLAAPGSIPICCRLTVIKYLQYAAAVSMLMQCPPAYDATQPFRVFDWIPYASNMRTRDEKMFMDMMEVHAMSAAQPDMGCTLAYSIEPDRDDTQDIASVHFVVSNTYLTILAE